MLTYVILKWMGNSWMVEGNGFVNKAKAKAYIKGNDTLRYTKVHLDVDCG